MKEKDSVMSKPDLFAYNILFRAAGVLLVLTLLSIWLVCGLFAKYTTSDSGSDSAKVAGAGMVTMREHKVLYSDGEYTLDNTQEVDSNNYSVVLPGTEIPKDPYIILAGNNAVSCSLYIEVAVSGLPGEVQYEIDRDKWTKVTSGEISAFHGGTVYRYNNMIPPHTSDEIRDIIKDNKIIINEDLKNKTDPNKNSEDFSIDLYAYLIQND